MVECLAINSMLKKQARNVRVYMGDLNTSYSFASVNGYLFMTSQGSGNHQAVAMVEWIKSKLSDNAREARAGLATNRLPESMHTGSQASLKFVVMLCCITPISVAKRITCWYARL